MGSSRCASSEVLDHLARSGEAVFARDADQRIIFWSRKCEEMLGYPARAVLGRRCHEITSGRDRFGNVYCHRGCPIAAQARDESDPVRRFPLRMQTNRGTRWFDVGTFAIPSDLPSLSALVHVLRPGKPHAWTRPVNAKGGPEPLAATGATEEVAALTPREKDTLKLLARGMTAAEIGRELAIAPVTVRNHISAVLQKLNVHSKFAAAAFAYQHHLV